jgi:hypothetical protein
MLAVSGRPRATLRCVDVDVGVSVALGRAAVGGLGGSLFRVQWWVSTLGRKCLVAMIVVPPAVAIPEMVRSAVGYDPVLRCARLAAFG